MTTYCDTETRSRIDIRFGTDRYSGPGSDSRVILFQFARDEAAPQLWDVIGGQPILPDLRDAIRDPNEPLVFWNSFFDWTLIRRTLGRDLPVTRFRCAMAQSYSHGLPGSLEMAGAVLEIPEEFRKLVDNKRLIDIFCVPRADGSWNDRNTHPAEWLQFCEYAIWDVHALRACIKKLPAHNYQGFNLDTWHLDQKINARGFAFDVDLAAAARKLLGDAKAIQDAETYELTGGAAQAATQRQKLLNWFESSGLKLPNMKASTMREWLEHDDLDPVHRLMLELRLEAAKSSGSKYRRGLELVGAENRIRGAKQFAGAGRTGRWSGRGFQPDNMMRPTTLGYDKEGNRITVPVESTYIEQVILPGIMSGAALDCPLVYGGPNEACANALRSAITAAIGNELVVADLSNIEGRVMAWIADAKPLLLAYVAQDAGEKSDSYKALAARIFGVPIEEVNDQQRQAAKVITLACQFGGSVGAFVAMAAGYNMDLDKVAALVLQSAANTEERLKKAKKAWWRAYQRLEDYGLAPWTFIGCHILVQLYREENKEINDLRHAIDEATKEAVKNPGQRFDVAKCAIWSTGTWLIIQLPSGRRLLYNKPKIEVKREEDLETGKVKFYEFISYMTARGKTWRREKAWGGLFIENIVQAIANDILRLALLSVDEDTWTVPEIREYLERLASSRRELPENQTAISGHVHDEISCDVPKGSYPKARLVAAMTTKLLEKHSWMRGLPLAAKAWVGPRYKK